LRSADAKLDAASAALLRAKQPESLTTGAGGMIARFEQDMALDTARNEYVFHRQLYTWLLNGADAIVFTDDIGVSSWKLREKVLSEVETLGIRLDVGKNRKACSSACIDVSSADSRTRLLVLPTDEERVILEEVLKLLD